MKKEENGEKLELPAGGRFFACLAQSHRDILEAQRLRYAVFADEQGARLPLRDARIDRDEFDAHCDHLLIRDSYTNTVVGTYRMLSADRARASGGFYSASEFDLRGITSLPRIVEVGRACVHPSYRKGSVIALLWAGLASYLDAGGYEYAFGSASIPVTGDGAAAASICARLVRDHLSPIEWRVFPRNPFPLAFDPDFDVPLPPLVRGYLRLGAYACGDPAWDPSFGTADVVLLLPVAQINPRYVRRLLRTALPAAA